MKWNNKTNDKKMKWRRKYEKWRSNNEILERK